MSGDNFSEIAVRPVWGDWPRIAVAASRDQFRVPYAGLEYSDG